MFVSAFELFKIGIGPSSSHTVGPMRAALRFVQRLNEAKLLGQVDRLVVRLHGSLAHTGKGHGTDIAVMLGLEGDAPDTVDVDSVSERIHRIESFKKIQFCSRSRKTLILTTGIHLVFRGSKSESDTEIEQKGKFLKLSEE